MAGSAVPYEDTPGQPGWGDVRAAMMIAAEVCAAAAVALAMRGPHAMHAAMMVRQATDGLRDISAQLQQMRCARFDEAVIEAERQRAAQDALTAHGLIPPQAPLRHLHVVS